MRRLVRMGMPFHRRPPRARMWRAVLLAAFALFAVSALTVFAQDEDDDTATRGGPGQAVFIVEGGITRIEQYGLFWELEGARLQTGRFVNGDAWVVGPVKVLRIGNRRNDPRFTPRRGQNGSMVNPVAGHDPSFQGYDDGFPHNYREELNAGLIDGRPVAPDNPLTLPPGSSLVSMASWLYRSADDREPGCPAFFRGATPRAPRPALRTGAILTVLDAPAPDDAFRPPYAGTDKRVRFRVRDLQMDRLRNLAPPPRHVPDPQEVADQMRMPRIQHVWQWPSNLIVASEQPNGYGRSVSWQTATAVLLLNLDFTALPGNPEKLPIAMGLVQYGIDLYGIASAGGGWPSNGGHHAGRLLPILFAGVLLQDPVMMGAGSWPRDPGAPRKPGEPLGVFQEYQQHFFVSERDVDLSGGPDWQPSARAERRIPYTAQDIGLPEWGFRGRAANKAFNTPYRVVNGTGAVGVVLAARVMGIQDLINHPPFVQYVDRYMLWTDNGNTHTDRVRPFHQEMWRKYGRDLMTWNPPPHQRPTQVSGP